APPKPPATSTIPSGSKVAVCPDRAVARLPVADQVSALAPALNTMPLTSISLPSTPMPVTLETSKVAVSAGPLGTAAGVQFFSAPECQQLRQNGSPGSRRHVALPPT